MTERRSWRWLDRSGEPRALLLQRARALLRSCRSLLTRWNEPDAALDCLLRAAACRELAQRKPAPCDECGGSGCGTVLDEKMSRPGRIHVYRDAPRMCRECLGGGVRLPSRGEWG